MIQGMRQLSVSLITETAFDDLLFSLCLWMFAEHRQHAWARASSDSTSAVYSMDTIHEPASLFHHSCFLRC